MPSLEIKRQVYAAAAAAEDKKAEDIRILALDPAESSLTDYFLICNGTNDRQNVAIGDEIEARMKRDFGMYPNSIEGRRQGEWILMDYVDFVVHIFSPEKREYYGLERLRKSAKLVSMSELDAELNNRVKAARVAKPVPAIAASDEVSATTPVPEVETHFASSTPVAPKSILSVAPSVVKVKTKKPAAKKKAVKTPAKKAANKVVAKKAIKKTATKKSAAKKIVKKVAAKKTVAKKKSVKKSAAKKAAKKVAPKKSAKKSVAKKKAAKKPAKKAAKKKQKSARNSL
jgi:ribosome-associated protein